MMRRLFVTPFVLTFILAAYPAIGADSPIDAIPQDVGLVIRLKSPEKTIKTISETLNEIQPGIGNLVQGQAAMLGVAISNPTLDGVDQSKDWWVAAIPKGEEDPQIVFLIPAKNIDDMRDAIDASFTFLTHDNWGIYSESEEAAKIFQSCIDGKATSLAKVLTGETKSAFDSGQASAFINLSKLTTVYKNQIEEARGSLDEFLDLISNAPIDGPGMNMQAVAKMYEGIFDGGFQVLKDAESAVVAVQFDQNGMQFNELLTARKNTKSAEYFASYKTKDADPLLKKLPENELVYFTLSANWAKLQAWGIKFATSMYNLNDDQQKSAEEIQKLIKGMDLGGLAGSMSLGDINGGVLRVVQIGEISGEQNWQKMLELSVKVLGDLEFAGIKQTMSLEKDVEKIDGKSIDIFRTKQTFVEDGPASAMQQKFMDIMYGPEGIVARLAYSDNTYLQTMGGGKPAMKRALASMTANQSMNTGSALAKDRASLGKEPCLVILADLPNLVRNIVTLVSDSGLAPIPIDSEGISDLKMPHSYLGFGITMKNRSVHCRTNIPIQTIKNGHKLGMEFYKMSLNQDEAF